MKKGPRYTIPPHPLFFGSLLFCSFLSGFGAMLGMRSTVSLVADPWFICLVSAIGAVIFSRNYVLDETGFTERILFFPRYKFRWESVGEVLVCEKSNDDERTRGMCIFVVTMRACDKFDPKRETIGDYVKRYRSFVTKIVVSKRKKQRYITMFEKTFGAVIVFD